MNKKSCSTSTPKGFTGKARKLENVRESTTIYLYVLNV